MKVEIISQSYNGEYLCFKVADSNGKIYIIDDCIVKEMFGAGKGYFGSYEGHPVHLNFLTNGNVELLLNYENMS